MRFKTVFLIILTIVGSQVLGQQMKFSEKIHWNVSKTLKFSDNDKKTFLEFTSSINDPRLEDLPIYFKRIPLPVGTKCRDIQLTQEKWEDLDEKEAREVRAKLSKYANWKEINTYKEKDIPYACLSFLPLRVNTLSGQVEKLVSFEMEIITTPEAEKIYKKPSKQNSILASGAWYKIGIKNSGVFKITYNDLKKLGVPVDSINPANIALFGNGGGMLPELNSDPRPDDLEENAIQVVDGGDGHFNAEDYVLFYGQGPLVWTFDSINGKFQHTQNLYSDEAYYFITTTAGVGLKKRIQNENSLTQTPEITLTNYPDRAVWERDLVNLINSGKTWLGEQFDMVTNYTFPFLFNDLNTSFPVKLKSSTAARSTTVSTFSISAGMANFTSTIPSVTASYTDNFAYMAADTFSFNASGPAINLTLNYSKPLSSSIGWLDFLEINVVRNLNFSGQQLPFRNYEAQNNGKLCQYILGNTPSNIKIWDITDPYNIKTIIPHQSGSSIDFTLLKNSAQEFVAFSGSYFYSVETYTRVDNQNLHSLQDYQMAIVTHPAFINEAQTLANLHHNLQNYNVLVVTPDQIYNEYSSGAQDITAIRDFLRKLYQNPDPNKKLKYALLFGDGSFDPKHRIPNNTNLVPAYEANNSTHPALSFVTDDYYGLFDDNEGPDATGALDIGVGRFPVNNRSEAIGVVDKVLRYTSLSDLGGQLNTCSNFASSISNYGDWRNVVTFVADDEDGNLHINDADNLATYVKTNYRSINVDKIYFDAYKQYSTPGGQRYPDVTAAINQRMNKGTFIMNYTGHGGELGWSHERVLEISDINRWSNTNNMPIFITATCEFSRYDNPQLTSAGELVMMNPAGGGIILLTTTRLAFSNSNYSLNLALYNYFFHKDLNGKDYSVSDIMYKAKNDNGNNLYIRNFVLLGDPALIPCYPKQKIVTNTINSQSATDTQSDTIHALSKVTVTGSVQDENGNKLTNFQGVVYPLVFDKAMNITTLANDAGGSYPFTFSLQKNVLYKGKAKVQNGDFSFTFIVPKDIAYQYGFGKISYYGKDDANDASGYYDNIVVGGVDTSQTIDQLGPMMKIYINDSKFINGGITNENPVLVVNLTDSGGINTVGNGIGHDLTATLDNVSSKPYVMNDYYEADLNSFQKGLVRYPFYNLTEGGHNLRVKVWDVFNNSSEGSIDFIVATSGEMALKHVLNYPNPFTTQTAFYFEHNQPCCELDVMIQVFTISGKLVKTIQQLVQTDGFRNEPIRWDGRDDFGDILARGVYLYKVRVRTGEGKYAEKMEKLVILK